jgi:uncharacterized membrane protein YedE/YeeE
MKVALLSLVIGTILGYLAQRSRMCFIGGLRDFILVRDTALIKGALAFFVTSWLAFSIVGFFGLVDWRAPHYQASVPDVEEVGRDVSLETMQIDPGQARTTPMPRSGGGKVLGVGWLIVGLTLAAGVIIGLFSTLANGCPTRQHVLAAQGVQDSMYYLGGFYLGVLVYYLFTQPLLSLIV